MKREKIVDFILVLTFVLGCTAGGMIDQLLDAQDEVKPKSVMCEIKQDESVHVMPCKILSSYLAEISL